MSVPNTEYDAMAPAMLSDVVPTLGCEFAQMPGSFMLMPVVLLPDDEAAWMSELSVADLAAMQADWRFLTTDRPTADRPALIRLDLRFPKDGRIRVAWSVANAADLAALSFACIADAMALATVYAERSIALANLGLRDLDGFREIATRVRSTVVLEALHG